MHVSVVFVPVYPELSKFGRLLMDWVDLLGDRIIECWIRYQNEETTCHPVEHLGTMVNHGLQHDVPLESTGHEAKPCKYIDNYR